MVDREIPRLMKIRRLFFALIAFFPWLPACSTTPKPPLILPFAVQQAGNKVETELRIVKRREYIFSLRFSFKEKDKEDRARVKNLVGDSYHHKDGAPGIATPLKFKINTIEAGKETAMLEQDIPVLRLRSWGADSFSKHIAYVILDPGRYRISVESLKDAPELIGTPVSLGIGYYHKP